MEKKEAMKILKDFHDKSALFSVRTALDTVIPELKESEDERIRKEIISHLRHECVVKRHISDVEYDRWIAWLEKQGEKESDPRYKYLEELLAADDIYQMSMNEAMVEEAKSKAVNALFKLEISKLLGLEKQCEQPQGKTALEAIKEEKVDNQNCVKPTDSVWHKFHEGDIIKPKDGGHEPWQIIQVDMFDKKYRFKDGYVVHFSQEDAYEIVEQKPAAWSEEDEQHIDSLLKRLDGLEEDEQRIDSILKRLGLCNLEFGRTRFAISEDEDWLKSLKDRVGCEANCTTMKEWSEEDALRFEEVMCMIEANGRWVRSDDAVKLVLDWLESFKQRIGG